MADKKGLDELLIWICGCTDDIPDECEAEDLAAVKQDILNLVHETIQTTRHGFLAVEQAKQFADAVVLRLAPTPSSEQEKK